METYYTAFVPCDRICTLKHDARIKIGGLLSRVPGSNSPAHMTAKRPLQLAPRELDAMCERLEGLVAEGTLLSFTSPLEPPTTFPGTGIVYLPVTAVAARRAIGHVLVATNQPRDEYDGITPHITLTEVEEHEVWRVINLVGEMVVPDTTRFTQLFVFEKTPSGSRAVKSFKLKAK